MPGLRVLLLSGLCLLGLGGCWSSSDETEISHNQRYFFLESLKQVEASGKALQSTGLSREALEHVLAGLDQGLKLAFQVERQFLDKLDVRLGKNYQRYFIEGVENYRLGVEAGDEAQQRKGLMLLQQWVKFWNTEQQAIQARLNPN